MLPFLDLVAYLIRYNLGLVTNEMNTPLDEDERAESDPSDEFSQSNKISFRKAINNKQTEKGMNFSNFKFILYVSYATPEEAIGRDLCLGLQTIV